VTSRRPQEPHPLHQSASPVDVPYVSRMPCLSANSATAVKHCREVEMLHARKPLESNSFCAISQNREQPRRSAFADRSHVSLEKIRKPVVGR
jgi:hypothetical protein